MRSLFVLLIPITSIFSFSGTSHPVFIDPTGTYILKGDVKGNKVLGHSGELRARLLSHDRVALSFYMNSGYPAYSYAAFVDSFTYDNNSAVYQSKIDSSCNLIFRFAAWKVEMVCIYSDPHTSCGFGQGSLTPSVMEKISSEMPLIQDMSSHRGE
jgi:hypothetical protein